MEFTIGFICGLGIALVLYSAYRRYELEEKARAYRRGYKQGYDLAAEQHRKTRP